jgi:fatty acid desaturase
MGKRRLGPSPHGGPVPLGRRVAYYAALIGLITLLGAWPPVLLLWFVPIMTLLPAILHLRSVSEHFGLPGGHELANARNVHTSFWERWLLAPHGIHRHLDHHLFPYVPFYRLAELHDILRDDADYRRLAYENGAYLFGGTHPVVQDLVGSREPRRIEVER